MAIQGIRRTFLASLGVVALAVGGGVTTEAISTSQINHQTQVLKDSFVRALKLQAKSSGVDDKLADSVIDTMMTSQENFISAVTNNEKAFVELPSVTATRRYAAWIQTLSNIVIQKVYVPKAPNESINIGDIGKNIKKLLKTAKI